MSRCDKLALAGVIIVSRMGVAFTKSSAYHWYFSQMPLGKLLIAIAGWALATYSPILVAALFWRVAKRSKVAWLLHVLLLPSFYGLLVAGNRLILSTLQEPDFDNTLGAPIMPALLVNVATVAVYFSALAVKRVLRLGARANVS